MFIYQNVKYSLCILQKIFSSQKTVQIFVGFFKIIFILQFQQKGEYNTTDLQYILMSRSLQHLSIPEICYKLFLSPVRIVRSRIPCFGMGFLGAW